MGLSESFRSTESKIQRGSFQFAYFLATLQAAGAEVPPQWKRFIESEESWQVAASHIFLHELKSHGLNVDDVSSRLGRLGILMDSATLTAQASGGKFPFTLILQLALVAPIIEFSRFVDHVDIVTAAAESAAKLSTAGRKPSVRTKTQSN
ncbi:hypothetical protein AU476_12710 [Cupriavidus sp. UYMSc13B]|nr:hypothetical protein AU476_12710 [Cupriavidus sp. UYMSc13B]